MPLFCGICYSQTSTKVQAIIYLQAIHLRANFYKRFTIHALIHTLKYIRTLATTKGTKKMTHILQSVSTKQHTNRLGKEKLGKNKQGKTLLFASLAISMMLTACNSTQQAQDTAASANDRIVTTGEYSKSAESMVAGAANHSAMPKMIPPPAMPEPASEKTNEKYDEIDTNPVHRTIADAISTFSIDTDTGSYANVRRFLQDGQLPPADAVRVEELINYFNYDFANASRPKKAPFLVSTETVNAPWRDSNRIIKIAIKAYDNISTRSDLPASNLVFLVDVSGSMNSKDKLPMVKASLKMLSKQLRPQDTISLITYAGNTEIVLPATSGKELSKILSAIDRLSASGSTNGEAAIKLAYQQAKDNFKDDGINRILMMTDGDFNVGVSGVDEMLEIIKRNRDAGVSLSTFGYGTGNFNDHMMEQVADNGNGNYSYIDSVSEAKKALVDEMSSTFVTVAKDVKVQVEFNPATVSEWRLIGYENRILADEDFNNDKVDAGELGAGKSVVALYEVTPVGKKGYLPDSRYQEKPKVKGNTNELAYLKLRYKAPDATQSTLLELPIVNKTSQASEDLNFAMAVAGYGQLLAGSKYVHNWSYDDAKTLAKSGIGSDPQGTRHEFVKLVGLADALN